MLFRIQSNQAAGALGGAAESFQKSLERAQMNKERAAQIKRQLDLEEQELMQDAVSLGERDKELSREAARRRLESEAVADVTYGGLSKEQLRVRAADIPANLINQAENARFRLEGGKSPATLRREQEGLGILAEDAAIEKQELDLAAFERLPNSPAKDAARESGDPAVMQQHLNQETTVQGATKSAMSMAGRLRSMLSMSSVTGMMAPGADMAADEALGEMESIAANNPMDKKGLEAARKKFMRAILPAEEVAEREAMESKIAAFEAAGYLGQEELTRSRAEAEAPPRKMIDPMSMNPTEALTFIDSITGDMDAIQEQAGVAMNDEEFFTFIAESAQSRFGIDLDPEDAGMWMEMMVARPEDRKRMKDELDRVPMWDRKGSTGREARKARQELVQYDDLRTAPLSIAEMKPFVENPNDPVKDWRVDVSAQEQERYEAEAAEATVQAGHLNHARSISAQSYGKYGAAKAGNGVRPVSGGLKNFLGLGGEKFDAGTSPAASERNGMDEALSGVGGRFSIQPPPALEEPKGVVPDSRARREDRLRRQKQAGEQFVAKGLARAKRIDASRKAAEEAIEAERATERERVKKRDERWAKDRAKWNSDTPNRQRREEEAAEAKKAEKLEQARNDAKSLIAKEKRDRAAAERRRIQANKAIAQGRLDEAQIEHYYKMQLNEVKKEEEAIDEYEKAVDGYMRTMTEVDRKASKPLKMLREHIVNRRRELYHMKQEVDALHPDRPNVQNKLNERRRKKGK